MRHIVFGDTTGQLHRLRNEIVERQKFISYSGGDLIESETFGNIVSFVFDGPTEKEECEVLRALLSEFPVLTSGKLATEEI